MEQRADAITAQLFALLQSNKEIRESLKNESVAANESSSSPSSSSASSKETPME